MLENNTGQSTVVLTALEKLAKNVLSKVITDKSDILYAPDTGSKLNSFNETVNTIITNKLRNKLIG